MSCVGMKVQCEGGFKIEAEDKKELAALTQWHAQNAHHKSVSEAVVLAMSKHP